MAFEPKNEAPVAVPQTDAAATTTEQPAAQPVAVVAKKKRAKWFLPAIIAGVVLLLAGGGSYAYLGVYMQTPENLWKTGLKNTGNGLQKYIDSQPATPKSTKLNGSFKLASPVAADGTIEGVSDEKNMKLTANAGAAGVRANMELRALTADGQTNPDIYLKVDGLTPIAALLGGEVSEIGEVVKTVENKWFMVDHSLLDQITADQTSDEKTPSNAELQKEIQDSAKKMAVVFNDYLFTTDDAKAVVALKEKLEKEDFKGRKSQHVKVQVRKDQLKAFLKELRGTVKGTYLEKQFLAGYEAGATGTGMKAPTLEELLDELDKVSFDNAVADVWIDTSLKYIRNVRITGNDKESNATTSVDFMLDYKGGDEFPLSITLSGKDKTGEGSISLGMLLNQKSSDVKFTIGVDGTFEKQKITFNADLSVKGSDEAVSVEKPAGATNIMELLGGLSNQLSTLQSQFGGITGGAASGSTPDCATQLEAYAASGGTTPVDAACQVSDDTEI